MGAFVAGTAVIERTTDTPIMWVAVLWVLAMLAAIAYRPVEKARRRDHLELHEPGERPLN